MNISNSHMIFGGLHDIYSPAANHNVTWSMNYWNGEPLHHQPIISYLGCISGAAALHIPMRNGFASTNYKTFFMCPVSYFGV